MADEAQQAEPRRRCAHTDVVYGRCVRYIDGHEGECVHERQPEAQQAADRILDARVAVANAQQAGEGGRG
ncbi:hypothetical protein AB0H77_06055 [Streptomyces sp. NPDC050844]|uniref:hypothetical protein n=1 Tax=Streptomyces sp. NPDC050844 TaxID=3155790 RepID=UPI0033C25A8D